MTFAQGSYPVIVHSEYSGLKSSHFRSIAKDAKGQIWVGSDIDLLKYQGGTFHSIDTIGGVPVTNVWDIHIDQKENMWLAMYNNAVVKITPDSTYVYSKVVLGDPRIRNFYEFQDKIYAIGDGGILRYNDTLDTWTLLPISGCDKKSSVFTCAFENNNRLFFSSFACGLFEYTGDTLRFVQDDQKSVFAYFTHGDSIAYTHGQRLYHITKDEVVTQKPILDNPSYSHIWNWTDSPLGPLGAGWGVSSLTGGVKLLQGQKMVDVSSLLGVTSKEIFDLYFDKEEMKLWVASMDQGLFWVDLSGAQREFTLDRDCGEIYEIEKWQNQYYIGSDSGFFWSSNFGDWNGFNIHELQAQKISQFPQPEKQGDSWFTPQYVSALKGVEDELFIGLPYNTLIWRDNRMQKVFPFGSLYFVPTPKGTYMGAAYQGVYRLDSNMRINEVLNTREYLINLLLYRDTLVVQGNLTRQIWVSGDSVERVYLEKEGLENYTYIEPLDGESFVRVSERKNFYKVTPSFTDGKRSIEEELWKPNTSLIGKRLIGIHNWMQGIILAITEEGIHHITDSSITFRPFFNDFSERKVNYSRLIHDTLYLSGGGTIYEIDLNTFFQRWNMPWEIEVEHFAINGEESESWSENTTLEIEELRKISGYVHSNLDLWNHHSNYRLVLKQRNRKFSSITLYGGEIDVDYLPAGAYDLFIQADNVLRKETKEIHLLKLVVLGPVFFRPWFVALMVSLLILGAIRITIFFSQRAQRKKELRNELERRISDSRIEALQSQMSPHFIFNALNSIQNLILNKQVDASLHYLNQFAILTRYALEKSSVKWISLEEELNFLQTYMDLENLRFQHEVDFQFEVDPAIDLQNTFIPPLLIQPLLENAFKHAYSPFMDPKTLNISIDQQGGNLEITIEDNGMGISDTPKKHRKSKGLFMLRERLELLYQDKSTELKITSSENSGTRITLKIPIDFARDNP